MTLKLVTLADAIKTDLDAGLAADDFSLPFSTHVLWSKRVLNVPQGEAKDIRVEIVPIEFSRQLDSANEWTDVCMVDIGIRKKITLPEKDRDSGSASDEAVKSLLNLVDELLTFFLPSETNDGRLNSLPSAVWHEAIEEQRRIPKVDVTILWSELQNQLFFAYFPLFYAVS